MAVRPRPECRFCGSPSHDKNGLCFSCENEGKVVPFPTFGVDGRGYVKGQDQFTRENFWRSKRKEGRTAK